MGFFIHVILPGILVIVGVFARPLARRWNRYADEHNTKHGFRRTEIDQPLRQVHTPIRIEAPDFQEKALEEGRKAALGKWYVPASKSKLRLMKVLSNLTLCVLGVLVICLLVASARWLWTRLL